MKKHKKSQPKTRTNTNVKDALILAGKRLFARRGLSGVSIRDIATEADVNSSMISYYFDGKEGLYKACIEEIGTHRLPLFKEILTPPSTKEEYQVKIKMFLENLLSLIYEDRDSGLMIIREYDRINSPAGEVFEANFIQLFKLLENFFKGAQKNKIIEKKIDALSLALLFFGTIKSQMRLDHVKEKFFDRSLTSKNERKKIFDAIVLLYS